MNGENGAPVSAASTIPPPAGWYQDPDGAGQRYWDGSAWTEHRAAAPSGPGSASTTGSLADVPAFWVAGLAIAGIVIGSFGTWATAGFISRAGIDGDGIFTLLLAIGAGGVLVGWQAKRRPGSGTALAILGVLAAAVGIIDLVDIESRTVELFGERADVISAGWGLYMVLAGSALLVAAGIALRRVPGARE